MLPGQRCGDCAWFKTDLAEINKGECRARPPTATILGVPGPRGISIQRFTSYPRVDATDVGCGEYDPMAAYETGQDEEECPPEPKPNEVIADSLKKKFGGQG